MIFPNWTLQDWVNLARQRRKYFDDDSNWSEWESIDGRGMPVETGWVDSERMLGHWHLPQRVAGWSAQLHKWRRADPREPLHTHQADMGVRVILDNGYDEEVLLPDGRRIVKSWHAGDIGLVPAALNHRLLELHGGKPCITIWARGPTRNPVTFTWPDGRRRTYSIEEMQ